MTLGSRYRKRRNNKEGLWSGPSVQSWVDRCVLSRGVETPLYLSGLRPPTESQGVTVSFSEVSRAERETAVEEERRRY